MTDSGGNNDNNAKDHPHIRAAADRLASIAGQIQSVTSSSVQAFSLSRLGAARPSTQDAAHGGSASAEVEKKWENLPKYKDLPTEGGWPGCAWNVWGKGDQLGTVNLLTREVVLKSAREEIKTGRTISLNWPLHLPTHPFFHRRALTHELRGKSGGRYIVRREGALKAAREQGREVQDRSESGEARDKVPVSDEDIIMNSQSGTQWDGMRHFGHIALNCFYGGVPRGTLNAHYGIQTHAHRPADEAGSESEKANLGIQNWAQHGICGRGVLLDVWGYLSRKALEAHGETETDGHSYKGGPYDPCTTHAITLADLQETATAQGVQFRQGDILLLRTGFIHRYYDSTLEERERWGAGGNEAFAGIEQSEEIKAFIWDQHFGAVAGDAPAFERWPPPEGQQFLHETLLGFYGCPIGEMFDLEDLSEHCAATNRWTFHFTSWPLNLYGGAASPANAAAYF